MSSSNAIGTGAVILTANADGVEPGLNKATSGLQKWAKDAGKITEKVNAGSSIASSVVGGIKNLPNTSLASAGTGIGMALGGPIGAGIGAAAGGLFSGALGSIKELASQGKIASALGVSSDQFMGLGLAAKKAGVDQESFGAALGKMEAHVAQAASKGGAYAESLSRIGLSTQQLAGMAPDQQFLAISTAIAGLPDSGQQAAAAMELFGKQGMQMLPMLTQGGAKLQEFADKQKMLGTALSSGDMEAVKKAAAAVPKIQAAYDGLWNRIVVAVAPVIEVVGNGLSKAFDRVQPVLRWIGEFASTYFTVWGAVLGEVIDLVGDVATSIGKWVGETLGLGDTTATVGGTMMSIFRGIGTGIAYVWDTLKAGAGIMARISSAFIDGFSFITSALKNVAELAKDLPDNIRPSWIGDLSSGLDKASKKADELAGKMNDWGKKQVGNIGKSDKDVQAWFDKLEAKMNAKDGADKKVKAWVDAADNVAQDTGDKSKLGGAFAQGSKEAYSIVARFQSDGMFKDDKAIAKEQVTWLARISQQLERMKEANQQLVELAQDEEDF
jgi:hypothetical protein